MKKLLYLLLAITFIGCSSDDNSNEEPANQLFLDIYDGVVWQNYLNDMTNKLTFNSDPSGLIESSDGSCVTIVFGEPYPFTDDDVVVTYTIQNEGQNSIVLSGQAVYNDGNTNPENFNITCTVSSGGNTLLLEYSASSEGEQPDPQSYTIAPDEFPCN
tara:strand:+ start:331 stop:804 length:474 start_codon:yes stop_codon:yes gene_type:complete